MKKGGGVGVESAKHLLKLRGLFFVYLNQILVVMAKKLMSKGNQ